MAIKKIIVAIELGSSKITGVAASRDYDGSLKIVAVAHQPSSSFIRKGMVYNIDKTEQCLSKIVDELEQTLKAKIEKAYVGFGGLSLHSRSNSISYKLEQESIISQELVDRMMDSNLNKKYLDMEIVEIIPHEYKVGLDMQKDPVGISTNYIEGNYLNLVARNTIRRNINNCCSQAKIQIIDYPIAPLALADVLLTDVQKRAGCALVDFGAQTTTVSVYKGGILRHLTVIPLGGDNITKDICSIELEEEEAEQLKKKHGGVCLLADEEEYTRSIYLNDGRTITKGFLHEIIQARVEEIIVNVWSQIILHCEEEKLLAGVIVTGGAAKMTNFKEMFIQRTNFQKVEVVKDNHYIEGISLQNLNTTDEISNTAIGLLTKCVENCCGDPLDNTIATTTLPTEQNHRDDDNNETKEQTVSSNWRENNIFKKGWDFVKKASKKMIEENEE